MPSNKHATLWGGRFSQQLDPRILEFTASLAFDRRLLPYDLEGSLAHVRMLGATGIIPAAVSRRLTQALERLLRTARQGHLTLPAGAEDVHTAVVQLLQEIVGDDVAYLQTARSRNDQVSLDLRLYARETIRAIDAAIQQTQRSLVRFAARHREVIVPGYTHLQRAQVVLLAHHCLAYVEMLERDRERYRDAAARVNVLPAGSGALSGTSLPIDRAHVANLLGFSAVSANSLDAVSDRDFVLELLSANAIVGMHGSRLAEDVLLWSTCEFGFLRFSDRVATGSSMMPQKKNCDALELVRGQSGLLYGDLVAFLTTMKGLPLAYNRDLQCDKEPFFDSCDRTLKGLAVIATVVDHLTVDRERLREVLQDDELYATDLAEFLVRAGLPFGKAHEVVGRLVAYAAKARRPLRRLGLPAFRRFSPAFTAEALQCLDARRSVSAKRSIGGTAPSHVHQALRQWERRLRLSSTRARPTSRMRRGARRG